MRIFVPRELHPGETRAALVPATVERLTAKGISVSVERGLGAASRYPDSAYAEAGATLIDDRRKGLQESEIVLRLRKPPADEVPLMKGGAIHVSYLDPFHERPLVEQLARQGVSALSMEMIPRTTLAQKMDALSSQANLAGYVAVIVGADHLDKVLPMMMTPAGTIAPSRVFVIGAGVAGLQAIATAKRLGARVEAFDTRPVVAEQVRSLGAKFVEVDLGETGQTKDGYATELTAAQQALQREAMAKVCAQSDLVITTAQLFGRRAPVIVTRDMIGRMRPGSVVVDLAVDSGGNVEGAELDKVVDIGGVRVVGLGNLPGRVATHASQMYSANLGSLIESYWSTDAHALQLNLEDEIIRGCLITHGGEVVNERIRAAYAAQEGIER